MHHGKSKHVICLELRVHVETLASGSAGAVSGIQILKGLVFKDFRNILGIHRWFSSIRVM